MSDIIAFVFREGAGYSAVCDYMGASRGYFDVSGGDAQESEEKVEDRLRLVIFSELNGVFARKEVPSFSSVAPLEHLDLRDVGRFALEVKKRDRKATGLEKIAEREILPDEVSGLKKPVKITFYKPVQS